MLYADRGVDEVLRQLGCRKLFRFPSIRNLRHRQGFGDLGQERRFERSDRKRATFSALLYEFVQQWRANACAVRDLECLGQPVFNAAISPPERPPHRTARIAQVPCDHRLEDGILAAKMQVETLP